MASRITRIMPPERSGDKDDLHLLVRDYYRYEITNRKGQTQRGELRAENLRQAIRILEKTSLNIISVEKAPDKLPILAGKAGLMDLIIFFRELAVMCHSGLTLTRSLFVLREQTTNRNLKAILTSLQLAIERGRSFSEAMALYPEVFSSFHKGIIKASEEGGFLEKSIDYLALAAEKELRLKNQIFTAINYPLILLTLGGLGTLAIVYWLFPFLNGLVREMGIMFPAYIRITLETIESLRVTYVAVPAAALLLISLYKLVHFLRRTIVGRIIWEKVVFAVPGVSDLVKKAVLTHSLVSLSALTATGISLPQALKISSEACNNFTIGTAFDVVVRALNEGRTISDGMREAGRMFPPVLISMIAVGEETGDMEAILLKTVELFEVELTMALSKFIRLIEPLGVIIFGILVGAILLTFFVPIYLTINSM